MKLFINVILISILCLDSNSSRTVHYINTHHGSRWVTELDMLLSKPLMINGINALLLLFLHTQITLPWDMTIMQCCSRPQRPATTTVIMAIWIMVVWITATIQATVIMQATAAMEAWTIWWWWWYVEGTLSILFIKCLTIFIFAHILVPFWLQRSDSLRSMEHRLGVRPAVIDGGDFLYGWPVRGPQVLPRISVLEDIQCTPIPFRYIARKSTGHRFQWYWRQHTRPVSILYGRHSAPHTYNLFVTNKNSNINRFCIFLFSLMTRLIFFSATNSIMIFFPCEILSHCHERTLSIVNIVCLKSAKYFKMTYSYENSMVGEIVHKQP